ncbi:Platinum sensitivity protein [Mortierella alpina]|nr:Platinum sensitivity protein [Mortierella alpina]
MSSRRPRFDKSEGTLVVRSELKEKEVLLSSRIRVGDDLYQRQQDTLIVWSEDDVDLALSFQEADGCSEIWDDINEVQQHYADDLFSDPANAEGVTGAGYANTSLPKPDLSNLTEIQELVKGAHADVAERVKLAAFIVIDNYIDKLLPVLEACEDLESISDLHALHSILLGIINLNDIAIIQYILKDDIFVGCVGILEYDPAQNPKLDLREILRNGSKYKQLVPVKDQDIEQKIHQVFRLQFLRDVVLTRFMDDGLSSILGSLIFFHNIDIVNYIHQDRTFLSELIGILHDDSETAERRRDVVRFIQQFCYIARTTQMPTRASIYRKLCQTGLFSVFEFALADSEPRIRMAGVEITLSAMEHDSNLIRTHVVARADVADQKQLFEIIVDQFLAEQDSGIMTQFAEVIRILLDMNIGLIEGGMALTTDASGHLDQDGNKFLDLFYSSYIQKLVLPLMAITNDTTIFERALASRCENVCHIMSFIVRQHAFRSKNFILSNSFVQQMCLLLKNRDQHLRLVALKFLRTCVGLKDEDYNGHLIELGVFTNVMDLFLATQNRNNLVNSVCLEFFDFIIMENIHSLGTHIIATSGKRLENVRCAALLNQLTSCFERPKDAPLVCADEQQHHGSTHGDETVSSPDIATNTEKEMCQNGMQNGYTAKAPSLIDAEREEQLTSRLCRKFVECDSGEEQDVIDRSRFDPSVAALERGEERSRHSAPSSVDAAKEQSPDSLQFATQGGPGVVESSAHNETGSADVLSEVALLATSRTSSALPVITPRTGILFVKAGTDMKDKGENAYVDVGVTKAAMQLRSDLATESLKRQQKPSPTPPAPGTEKVGKRRREEGEPVRRSKGLRMEAERKIGDQETESHFRIEDLLPKGSRMVTESMNGSSFGAEDDGEDGALEEVTATVAESIELSKDTATPVANIG